jgi:2-keto-4-pentenoate hydratase
MACRPGAPVDSGLLLQPRIEAEIAFVLAHDLTGRTTGRADVAAATAHVLPALEIVDSRIANWDIGIVDTVADNASCGAIAVSSIPLDVDPAALLDIRCSLVIDGEVTGSGTGTDVMGHPVAPLAWLANVLGEQGVALEAGQLILPGSFTKAMPVVADSTATADFGPLGSLTIHFTD